MDARGQATRSARSGPQRRSGAHPPGEIDAYSIAAVPLAALAATAAVALGGSDAYWLCTPVAVLAAAVCRSRVAAALLALFAVGAAAAPALLDPALGPLPSPLLALVVPALSAFVARLVRERLEAGHAALRALARLDPLTGLSNRRALDDRLGYEVARHRRHERSFALLMLDLDGFKSINTRFGHSGGDELLRDVGSALHEAVREQDTVARLGGDEFCVLAPETTRAEAERLDARLREAIAGATVGFDDLSGSVGCAVFPDDGQTAVALMTAADGAQAEDKRRRRRESGRRPVPAAA